MKKTLIILVLIFTLFGCERNYIKDFKIEGIALGDSLLDKYTLDEILKSQGNYYPDTEFNSSALFSKTTSIEYDQIEVGYKTNDSKYLVHKIGGAILYEKDIENCYPKKKEIVKNLSKLLKNTDWQNYTWENDKGKFDQDIIILETGETAAVECYDWSKDTENNLGWVDNLRVQISSAEWEEMLYSQ